METNYISVQSLWKSIPGYNCFGCAPHNQFGLKLKFYPHEAGIRSLFNLSHSYSSYPGMIHGGIVATILDEVMGNTLVIKAKRLSFTLSLSLRYLAPVLPEQDYSSYAEIKKYDGDFAEVQGSIYDQENELIVRAKGSYKVILSEEAKKIMNIDEDTLERFQMFLR